MKSFLSILILTSLCASAEDSTPSEPLSLKRKTAPQSITSRSANVRMMKGKFANANCKIINGKWVCDETADAKKMVKNTNTTRSVQQ